MNSIITCENFSDVVANWGKMLRYILSENGKHNFKIEHILKM